MSEIIRTEGCFFEQDFSELQARVGAEGGKIACNACVRTCEIEVKGRTGTEGVQITTPDAQQILGSCSASFATREKVHIARKLIANDGKGCFTFAGDNAIFGSPGPAYLFLDKPFDDPDATLKVGYTETQLNDYWRPL